jgi:uncharacterized protein with NRDE domain
LFIHFTPLYTHTHITLNNTHSTKQQQQQQCASYSGHCPQATTLDSNCTLPSLVTHSIKQNRTENREQRTESRAKGDRTTSSTSCIHPYITYSTHNLVPPLLLLLFYCKYIYSVLASNRDEYLERETSRANFWDLDPVLSKAIRQSSSASSIDTDSSDTAPVPAPTSSQRPSPVGVLTGQDLQASQAINYTIQELFSFSSSNQEQGGQEQLVLTLDTKDIPGTWLGMTTHGDFVALTNFRESMEYMAMKRDPKLSRGKVCGEFLVTMAAAHHKVEEDEGNEDQDQDRAVVDSAQGSETETGSGDVSGSADEIVNGSGSTEKNWNRSTKGSRRVLVGKNQAEKWIRRRAVGWEDEFEGLNLLVVQNAGDHQVVGGNRLGSELIVFNSNTPDDTITVDAGRIEEGSVVGVSNSVFSKPWTKVKLGVKALENVLNQSINLFGTASRASYTSNNSNSESDFDDDTREIAWLVINMLTLLRTITHPFPEEDSTDSPKLLAGLSERVFVPRIALGGMEYGTRSSTIALFGREKGGVAVFVEKVWYSDKDVVTGERTAYAPDSAEGLHWWQGRVGQPRQQWRLVVGDDLENLLQSARDIRPYDRS